MLLKNKSKVSYTSPILYITPTNTAPRRTLTNPTPSESKNETENKLGTLQNKLHNNAGVLLQRLVNAAIMTNSVN